VSLIVFGGSFDPPHRGHVRLLRAALRELKDARAVVVPAFRSPLKAACRVKGRERLALVRAALRDGLPERMRSRVSIDPFELERGRTTYSFETLRHLQRKTGERDLRFLSGSDAFAGLPRWKNPREVVRLASFLVGRRPGARLPSKTPLGARATTLSGEFPRISSTKIRIRLLLGKRVARLLSDSVLERIDRGGLYGSGLRARLAGELKPGRFAHTEAVARRAAELAKRFGLDPERAALAGLLHDCGRAIGVKRMASFARRRKLRVPALEETAARQPMLLHAHVSEFRARTVYGIEDPEVLSAVRKHTLGDAHMSDFDRLIYAADATSADRRYRGVSAIRAALREDLDGGFAEAVRRKLEDVIDSGRWLHPSTAAVWNAACEHL
jgi:nicotinate-nucleotide adenylyltransferase